MSISIRRRALLALGLAALAGSARAQTKPVVRIGSKIDTEGSLLGNIIAQMLEGEGIKTSNELQLGATKVMGAAITGGAFDIYPEYTDNGAFFFSDEKDPAWKNA